MLARSAALVAFLTLLHACRPEPQTDPLPAASSVGVHGDSLTLMTFNAEWLWDGQEPEEGSSTISFAWKGNAELAERHMQSVAEVIRRADADVVMLQEVENAASLAKLNTMLDGMGYQENFAQGRDTFTGQDVAMLTRVEPVKVTRTANVGTSGERDSQVTKNLIARFNLPDGTKLALLTVHFISGASDPIRTPQREAQADALRDAAVELRRQGYFIVILGDVNDIDGEVPDAADSRPLSRVVRILREMDPEKPGDDLLNAATKLPQERRATNWWDRDNSGTVTDADLFSQIDHVLLSPELFARIASVDIPRHDPTLGSDHFPIVVTLGPKPADSSEGR